MRKLTGRSSSSTPTAPAYASRCGWAPATAPTGPRTASRSSPADQDFRNSNLFTINPDGSGRRQITHVAPRAELLSASFSPDGRLITFAMTGLGGKRDIWTTPVGGGELTPVTRSPERDSAPKWDSAPDWDATT